MATIFSSNGKLFYNFTCPLPNGDNLRCRESANLADTKANRATAELTANLIEAEIKAGRFNYLRHFPAGPKAHLFRDTVKPALTFREFSDKWLDEQTGDHSQRTNDAYRTMLAAHAYPAFGHNFIGDVTKQDIIDLRGLMKSSPSAFNFVLGRLRTILEEALDRDLIPKNVARKVERLKEAEKSNIRYTLDEVHKIIEAMPTAWRPREWVNYFTLAFYSGMRPGEIRALRCTDADFDDRVIHVTKSRGRYGEGPTKTRKNRDVPILPAFEAAIQDQWKNRLSDTALLFCQETGKPWSEECVRKVWDRTLEGLEGIVRRVPYITRHTCVTNMLKAGEAVAFVSALVGHKASAITLDVYNGVTMDRQDGQKFSEKVREAAA